MYNIGALEFGTMRETLQALVDHAQTGSRVRSLPVAPARFAMQDLGRGSGSRRSRRTTGCSTASRCTSTCTKARTELAWEPKHSNASMVIESYEWFLAHRGGGQQLDLGEGSRSHHQSPVRLGLVRALKALP